MGDTKNGIGALPATVIAVALLVALITIPFGGNAALPHWVRWETSLSTCDLDNDGAEEGLFINRGRLAVQNGANDKAFVTPHTWHVSNAFFSDIDCDGAAEAILVAWRRGSYGSSQPFWVSLNSSGFSQHVFVFDYDDARLVPLWMSSALGFEAHEPFVDDLGRLHLVTEEGNELVFVWESWGFVLLE